MKMMNDAGNGEQVATKSMDKSACHTFVRREGNNALHVTDENIGLNLVADERYRDRNLVGKLANLKKENDMLKDLLEEEFDKSEKTLEELDEKLSTLEQKKNEEIAGLDREKEDLQMDIAAMKEKMLAVESENEQLKRGGIITDTRIEALKSRRDRRKKSIEDRLRSYQVSSEKNSAHINSEETLSTVSEISGGSYEYLKGSPHSSVSRLLPSTISVTGSIQSAQVGTNLLNNEQRLVTSESHQQISIDTLTKENAILQDTVKEANASIKQLELKQKEDLSLVAKMKSQLDEINLKYDALQKHVEGEEMGSRFQALRKISDLEHQLSKSQETSCDLQSNITITCKENETFKGNLANANKSLGILKEKCKNDEAFMKEIETLLDEANSNSDALRRELQERQTQKDDALQENLKLKEELKSHADSKHTIQELQSTINALNEEHKTLKTSCMEANESIYSLQQKNSDQSSMLEELQIQINRSSTGLKSLREEQGKNEEMQHTVSKLKQVCDDRERTIASSRRIFSRQKRELMDDFEAKNKQAEDEISSLRQKFEAQMEKTDRNRKAFQKEKRHLQGKKEELEKKQKEAENEISNIRRQLESKIEDCNLALKEKKKALVTEKEDMINKNSGRDLQMSAELENIRKDNEELRALLECNKEKAEKSSEESSKALFLLERETNRDISDLERERDSLVEKIKHLAEENKMAIQEHDDMSTADSLGELEERLLFLETKKNAEIAILVEERDDHIEKRRELEKEIHILKTSSLHDDDGKSTGSLEFLEERLYVLEKTRKAEVDILAEEKDELELETRSLRETIKMLEKEIRSLRGQNRGNPKPKRERKQKMSIEERLMAYEQSSSCANSVFST